MTNVIGPIDRDTFYTMGMLRENVREMTRLNRINKNDDYKIAILKQNQILKDFFDIIKKKEDRLETLAA